MPPPFVAEPISSAGDSGYACAPDAPDSAIMARTMKRAARVPPMPDAAMALLVALAAGCGGRAPATSPPRTGFDVLELDTANGLSGLAREADGTLWTVAERAQRAYRITLDGDQATTIAVPVENVPPGVDLESIAVLDADRVAFGTEGSLPGSAMVLIGEHRGPAIHIVQSIALHDEAVGIAIGNRGVEGLCGRGDTLVAALEATGTRDGRRFAPLVWIERGAVTRVQAVWLTSETGKLSSLECDLDAQPPTAWAIERHFEVTRILELVLLSYADAIEPTILVDVTAEVAGKRNLEGLTRLDDGRFATVVDNQFRTITGPNELLIIAPP